MVDWLNVVTSRLRITFFCWHQCLSALGCFSVLSVTIFTGLEIDSLGPQLSTLIAPYSFVSNTDNAQTEVLASQANRQELGTGMDSPQTPGFLSLTFNQDFNFFMQGANPTISFPLRALAISIPSRLPEKLDALGSEDRKELFIDFLLPAVTVALDEVKQERQQLLTIIAELGKDSTDLLFDENKPDWQRQIGADKSKFILGLTRKYRSESADELVAMINVLPPSLIIAQSAIESGWGSSRFALEVNNLFGMYSYVDTDQSTSQFGGKAPKIIEYESILDSVRSYVLNINRLSAYKELRQIRCQTFDSMLIANGLAKYSERKEYYIADIKQIIAHNNLRNFDIIILASV